jgi:HEPN domain-containing protein
VRHLIGTLTLHQRFFEAALLDLDGAKALIDRGLYPPSLYHLQQTYEKCIKSYFIFKEVNFNKTPETTVYNNIQRRLGHDTEESTIILLKDTVDLEKHAYENKLSIQMRRSMHLRLAIKAIDGYKSSLDHLVQVLNLRRNYISNVKNYAQLVNRRYEYYQNTIIIISKQPDMTFLTIVNCMANLFPCFYKMELVSRYPLDEFAYDNLNLLSDLKQPCQKLVEMLGDLVTLESSDLK